MYIALQVCLNNAVQHAKATVISANIWENEGSCTVMIRNNGTPPDKKITEGGGLTKRRLLISGLNTRETMMKVQSSFTAPLCAPQTVTRK